MTKNKGFTLIELLIVVAIIAILAAIAVPNFLEAQVRAKISRIKADMRTIATAIEAYTVDNNRPPIGYTEYYSNINMNWPQKYNWGFSAALPTDPENDELIKERCYSQMTTPLSYITSIPADPFGAFIGPQSKRPEGYKGIMEYDSVWNPDNTTTKIKPMVASWGVAHYQKMARTGYSWYLFSLGPRKNRAQLLPPPGLSQNAATWPSAFYDSSNGTVSAGCIVRSNKMQH